MIPMWMRAIKDVSENHLLKLEDWEDCTIYVSKINKYPTPQDYQFKHKLNEVIKLDGNETGQAFETKKFYLGIYSMSGLDVRLGFSFR